MERQDLEVEGGVIFFKKRQNSSTVVAEQGLLALHRDFGGGA